jgi:hypothetical protein
MIEKIVMGDVSLACVRIDGTVTRSRNSVTQGDRKRCT